ncbi:MAG: hypothetical protein AB9880_03305 [Christensenellales bacterium]
MKRLMNWCLMLTLILSLLPIAGLAADTLQVELAKEVHLSPALPEAPALTITNTSDHNVLVTVEVYDEAARSTVQTLQFTLLQGDAPYTVNTHAYKMLAASGDINTYRYRVTTDGGFKKLLYAAQVMHIAPVTMEITWVQWRNPIYPRNTVTSFGPQFRVLTPDLTDEWYMFTPIDLTIQGRQTFQLIGGNALEVGEVYVDTFADSVTVTYQYYFAGQSDKIEPLSEFLYFFPAYSTITTVDPKQIASSFAFGVPLSIAQDLGGDTNVLMFVRNIETFYRFPVPTAELLRNQPKSAENHALRQHMLDIMDPIEGVVLVNDHNYAN